MYVSYVYVIKYISYEYVIKYIILYLVLHRILERHVLDKNAVQNTHVKFCARKMGVVWGILQVPHKSAAEKPGRIAEQTALEQQRKNQSYQLVSDSDEDAQPAPAKVI